VRPTWLAITPFRAALAIVAAFGVLACTYSVVNPPWESPDEVGHFEFITILLTKHILPVQQLGDLGEAQQTPLYYLLAAIVASPADLNDPTGAFQSNAQFMWSGRGGQEINAGLHGSAETFPFHGVALAMHLARLTSVLLGVHGCVDDRHWLGGFPPATAHWCTRGSARRV
jgi:hypothetical protein